MELVWFGTDGRVIDRRLISPRAGFMEVPGPAHRVTLTTGAGGQPQVWLLSVDGRREECAWDSGARPTCPAPVTVVVVAEYADGRLLDRRFCGPHADRWAEGLTGHPTIHDLRVPPEPGQVTTVIAIPRGAVGHNTILILGGRRLRVQRYIHKTNGDLHVWVHEQFTAGGEGPEEHLDLGQVEHLYVPRD
jgi:hypothetical protein